MTFEFGLDEARADGVDELFGDETVGATADDHHRTAVCARVGASLDPVVPDVDVVGRDFSSDWGADVGELVELVRR